MKRILLPLIMLPLLACASLQKAQVSEPAVLASDQALSIRLNNRTIAQIRADGTVVVARDAGNSKAAMLFWAAVASHFPFQPMYEKLVLENVSLMERLVVLRKDPTKEQQEATTALQKQLTTEQEEVSALKKQLKALQSLSKKKVVKETPNNGEDQRERAGAGGVEAGGREEEPVDRTSEGSPEVRP